MLINNSVAQEQNDPELELLRKFFHLKLQGSTPFGGLLRQAFDEVIDGVRTGRYCLEQLEKTEKTYIGTKVEIIVRAEFELGRGAELDNLIHGIEVDTKFSLSGGWMIPREAFNKVCLLIAGSDKSGNYEVGLLRMTPDVLTSGANRDGKLSVSAVGRQLITWIEKGKIPSNFLLEIPEDIRKNILSQRSGMQRVHALFKSVTGKLIPRKVVEQVAQQKDPMRRARQMKAILGAEGYVVLCAKYDSDRDQIIKYGYAQHDRDDWLVMKS